MICRATSNPTCRPVMPPAKNAINRNAPMIIESWFIWFFYFSSSFLVFLAGLKGSVMRDSYSLSLKI